MSGPDKLDPDGLQVEQAVWDMHRRKWLRLDVDLNKDFAEWAAKETGKLDLHGARIDFDELCRDGCVPQVLATALALLRFSPRAEIFWAEMVGNPAKRHKVTRTLGKAASLLQEILGDFIAAEDESQRKLMAHIGHLPPSRLISELHFYSSFLNLAEGLRADTGTRSVRELSKYLLTSYVKRITGRFHDKNVCGLVGEIVGPVGHDETAQRMWRSRNYKRLESHYSKLTDFLIAMGVVVTRRT